MSLWSLVHTGEVVGKQFCYHEIPERLDPYDYEAFLNRIQRFMQCAPIWKPERQNISELQIC